MQREEDVWKVIKDTILIPGDEEPQAYEDVDLEAARSKLSFLTRRKLKEQIAKGERSSFLHGLACDLWRQDPPLSFDEVCTLMESAAANKFNGRHDARLRIAIGAHRAKQDVEASKPKPVHFEAGTEVELEAPEWIWNNVLPLGEITIIAGEPDKGKSLTAIWIAAELSRGRLQGDAYGQPGKVVVFSTEDRWKSTILPRFVAAGGDRSMIFRPRRPVYFPDDYEAVIEALEDFEPICILFDPISQVRAGGKNWSSHNDNDVRKAFEPITSKLMESRAVAIGIAHLNKGHLKSEKALHGVMGSIAYVAVPRSVLLFKEDPNEAEGVRYMFHVKGNLIPDAEKKTHKLQIKTNSVRVLHRGEGKHKDVLFPYIEHDGFEENLDEETHRIMAAPESRAAKRQQLRDILVDLFQSREEVPAKELRERTEDYAVKTVRKVGRELGIESRDGRNACYVWPWDRR